jgi:acyl-[acyl-carrier-protein] desaturase
MNSPLSHEPALLREIYNLYRNYFDMAEKRRRWSLKDDIPWGEANRALSPAVADVVQTFCCVELYLPDYLGKLIPQVRDVRGRAWFLANWGYEESKHSLAMGDWLLHSGHRTEEELADIEHDTFALEWDLPHDSALGMVCYTTFQELATWLHYKNLQKVVHAEGGCPALERVLHLIAIDERAHYDFFKRLVQLYLRFDRRATLEQLRQVVNTFRMPAVHMWTDSRARMQAVKELRIFDDDIFFYQVFEPVLRDLGVKKAELRRRNSPRELVGTGVQS